MEQQPEPAPESAPLADAHVEPSVVPSAALRLIDPGHPPRRKLRYAWQKGRKEIVDVDLRTATSTEGSDGRTTDIPLSPIHITIAIDPSPEGPEGSLTYTWRVTSASIADSPETPPDIANGVRAEVSVIEHLTGNGEVTARGLATHVEVDPGSAKEARATGQMVEQVRQILRDLAVPFPEEEIGLGARWEKISELASKDVHVVQSDTFSLKELLGSRGVLDDVLTQSAPAQTLASAGAMAVPLAPPTHLASMLASGDAKTQFDLSRLTPRTRFDGATTMDVGEAVEGSRHLKMRMRIEIIVRGSVVD